MVVCMRFLSPRARRRGLVLACVAMLAVISVTAVRTEEPPVFAITNARIIPVNGATIEKGTILLRRGTIESVGANITIPGDARVIDAAGLTAYPGLIDAYSDIGLEEPVPTRAAPAAAAPAPAPAAAPEPAEPDGTPVEQDDVPF
jgi:hypothetical protein